MNYIFITTAITEHLRSRVWSCLDQIRCSRYNWRCCQTATDEWG